MAIPDVVFPLLLQHRSTSTFQPLICVLILSSHPASLLLIQSRNNLFELTLKVFFTPYLARKIFLMPYPWIFAVFLCSRTLKGKSKSMRPDVCTLDSGVSSLVSALYVWPTPLLIRTLASWALSSPTLVVREIGTELSFLVTQPLICWLSSILKKSQRSNFRLVSPPKQAVPLFPDKLLLLSRHLKKRLLLPSLSPAEIFITARDQAFFKALFFSGDRGGDLGKVKTSELARFLDDNSFLFNHVWGKTLRDGASNLFGMRRHPNPTLCPIRAVETYVAIALELGISLSSGYLSRSTNPQGHIVDNPFFKLRS